MVSGPVRLSAYSSIVPARPDDKSSPRVLTRPLAFLLSLEPDTLARAVEVLLGLLDARCETEDDPIYPGNPAYLRPPIEFASTFTGAIIDPDTEWDPCDCEEDNVAEDDGTSETTVDEGDPTHRRGRQPSED